MRKNGTKERQRGRKEGREGEKEDGEEGGKETERQKEGNCLQIRCSKRKQH